MKRQWISTDAATPNYQQFNLARASWVDLVAAATTVNFNVRDLTNGVGFANNAAAQVFFDDVKDFLDRQQQLETITP